MSYNLAYSVLTPITNGETGLRVVRGDPHVLDAHVRRGATARACRRRISSACSTIGYDGFYICAVFLIIAFFIALRITRSPFGLALRGIKSNQTRMAYTGFNTRPYTLAAFVISGMYAGLAGSLLAVTDPLAGAERMQWTASGEVVLMTILGGAGTLIGPILGAGIIKYFENIFSSFNEQTLCSRPSRSCPSRCRTSWCRSRSLFVGEGWHLTLGLLFMLVVIFLPGGIMEGFRRIVALRVDQTRRRRDAARKDPAGGIERAWTTSFSTSTTSSRASAACTR